MKNLKNLVLLLLFMVVSVKAPAQNEAFEVHVKGAGEPLLFFPGFACTDEVWDEIVTELSKKYECHVFTFAGFGDVPPVAFPWYPKMEEAVWDYIKSNDLENAIPIGHSLGGTLALSLATRENVFEKLIIVDALTATGALMIPDYKSEHMVYDSPYNNRILSMGEGDFRAMATQMASGMTLHQEKQDQIVDWMLMADRKTYVYGYTDYLKVDLRKAVSAIQIPVTIFAATHPFGKEMVKKTYEEQYKNLAHYDLRFAEGSAHFIMYDKPKWLVEQLIAVLTNNE